MSVIEQLKEALDHTNKITKGPCFTTQYTKDEQEFFKTYAKELTEELNAEYEAIAFIAKRDREKEHGAA
jgi:hypothetical protein